MSRRALTGFRRRTALAGAYVVYDFSTLPGKSGDYEDTLLPHAVISPYLTWTSDRLSWGVWGASFGGTYVGKTAADRARPHHLSVIYGAQCQRLCAMGLCGKPT